MLFDVGGISDTHTRNTHPTTHCFLRIHRMTGVVVGGHIREGV